MNRIPFSEHPFVTLENVTLRVQDRFILAGTSWEIKTNEHWAVLGPNGSGKSSLVGALTGEVPVVQGTITRHYPQAAQEVVGYVSFELHQRLIAREEARDEARYFSGQLDAFAKTAETILSVAPREGGHPPDFERIVKRLEIDSLLDRGIRFLSTGEMRKVLIARALMKSPMLLILDEPFDGLDVHSKERLAESINALMNGKMQIVLVTHRLEEITPNISHVLCLKDGKVMLQGRRDQVLTSARLKRLYDRKEPVSVSFSPNVADRKLRKDPNPAVMVEMKNTTVKYGNLLVLNQLNWVMKQGENWAILGPNGAGKSTLLNLIVGDNPQAYANEIYLFGKRKGTGESVWGIKRRIGIISSELQVHYRKRIRVYEVVLSGFFDSIGVYRHGTPEQLSAARQWLERLGLPEIAQWQFDRLSFGQKRLVLLARSMVKSPEILILDEPCQGLDAANRKMILDLIEYVGSQTHTQLLYVTHHEEEIPPCVTHVLRLEKPQTGS